MAAALRIVRLIQIAMLVSVGIYAVLGEVVGARLTTNANTLYAISFASISLVGAMLVVRKTLVLQSEVELRDRPGDPTSKPRYDNWCQPGASSHPGWAVKFHCRQRAHRSLGSSRAR